MVRRSAARGGNASPSGSGKPPGIKAGHGAARAWDLRAYKHGALLHIKVQPNAKKNTLEDAIDGVLRIKLTAPPVQGAANAHCLQFVSDLFRIPKSRIEIVRGLRSKEKWLWFKSVSPSDLMAILTAKQRPTT